MNTAVDDIIAQAAQGRLAAVHLDAPVAYRGWIIRRGSPADVLSALAQIPRELRAYAFEPVSAIRSTKAIRDLSHLHDAAQKTLS
jgi:hypothetical protein